ncbi:DUF2200 domain-containing protein [Corynebacterium epidermidicanis]|uniref:DUF2200 family protein n=1 Tax=Corynebacterium epidermidicanis TaxID=1050174 RepID=A0A0G3GRD8_9CORY|nr:DUF2200 domain-containing protein [Corynebacterium epidermidicanis]AKK03679.1 hypothetical protein CEPID_09165 [Corynebacterium epidermidicanis]
MSETTKTSDEKAAAKLERVYNLRFAEIYRLYLAKVERKGRTREDLDEVLMWLTGYSQEQLQQHANSDLTLRELCAQAPVLQQTVPTITGVICGYRVENIEDPLMQQIRAMDKVVDELAKGKALAKIKRDLA